MVFVISQKNNCTYTLDPDNDRVLMYAPLLSDGSYETTYSAYDWVEWDRIDEDMLEEADRCNKALLEDVPVWELAQHPLRCPLQGAILHLSLRDSHYVQLHWLHEQ